MFFNLLNPSLLSDYSSNTSCMQGTSDQWNKYFIAKIHGFFSIWVHNSLYHNVGFSVLGFDHCDLDPTFQMHMRGSESYNEHDNVLPNNTSGPDWSKDNKQLIWNTCITIYCSLIWLETVLNSVTIEGDSNTAFQYIHLCRTFEILRICMKM